MAATYSSAKASKARNRRFNSRKARFYATAIATLVFLAGNTSAQQTVHSRLSNPFFVFDDGLGGGRPEKEAALAKQIGFAGISFDKAELIPERLKAVEANGLQFFYVYLAATVGKQQVEFEPGFEDAIAALKGRNTVVWLTIRGNGPNAEAQAVEAAQRTADVAAAANLRVALYPHYGFYVQTMRQALQIADKAGRSNLGVTFNLCHELRSGLGSDVTSLLKSAFAAPVGSQHQWRRPGWPQLGPFNSAAQ